MTRALLQPVIARDLEHLLRPLLVLSTEEMLHLPSTLDLRHLTLQHQSRECILEMVQPLPRLKTRTLASQLLHLHLPTPGSQCQHHLEAAGYQEACLLHTTVCQVVQVLQVEGCLVLTTCLSILGLPTVRTPTPTCPTKDLIPSAAWLRCLNSWQDPHLAQHLTP